MLQFGRRDAHKAVFLMTDGYSNGGDPRPAAEQLKHNGVEMFTFGIRNGNYKVLVQMVVHMSRMAYKGCKCFSLIILVVTHSVASLLLSHSRSGILICQKTMQFTINELIFIIKCSTYSLIFSLGVCGITIICLHNVTY